MKAQTWAELIEPNNCAKFTNRCCATNSMTLCCMTGMFMYRQVVL